MTKVLIVTIMIAMYLAAFVLLFADTLPLGWLLLLIVLHMLYSCIVVWLYGYMRVKNMGFWASFLIPILTTTSTFGLVIWIVFKPEERIRNRYYRH